jgi:hypothetical protein
MTGALLRQAPAMIRIPSPLASKRLQLDDASGVDDKDEGMQQSRTSQIHPTSILFLQGPMFN